MVAKSSEKFGEKFMMPVWMRLSVCTTVLTSILGSAESLPLQHAIRLAVAHSAEMAIAEADVRKATAAYVETRSAYIPQLGVGSNAGYAYGFPLSLEGAAPTLFNVTTQSSVWNPALREFVRSADSERKTSEAQSREQREQVILDTTLVYIDLDKAEEKRSILLSEAKVAAELEREEGLRVQQGIDSLTEQTKAKLVSALLRVQIAQTEGAIDVLRTRLAQLTGLPADSIETVRQSIPLIENDGQSENLESVAIQSSAAVEAANESALARQLRAKGEHKGLYPTADFAAQYGLISTTLTNYEQFFVPHSFHAENVTVGLVLRLNILNASQRAKAASADAEALRAEKQAEQVRNRVVVDSLKLRHDVEQFAASADVAQLRCQLAQTQLDAAQSRVQSETGGFREVQNAAIDAANRALERIDADFDLEKAQLQLLRATGKLENWALSKR
jgi:outer membrane protein